MTDPAGQGRLDRRWGRCLFAFLLCLYLLGAHGYMENPDGEVTFLTAKGIALKGDPALTPDLGPAARVILDHEQESGGNRTRGYACAPGRDGRYYAWFGIGHALWNVPFYLVGKGLSLLFPAVEEAYARGPHPLARMAPGLRGEEYFPHLLVSLSYPLAGALTGWVLYGFALVLGLRRSTALLLALVYGVATMAWPFSRESLSDGPATLMGLLFLRALFAWHRGKAGDGALLGAGLWGGAMVAIRPMLGLYLLPLALWVLLVLWRRRRAFLAPLARFTLPLLLFALGLTAYNLWRFGSPLKFGYHEQYSRGFWSFPGHLGVALQLFAPGKGLLPFNLPLLGLFALIGSSRRPGRTEVLLFTLPLLLVLLPVSFTSGWHGGQCWGPRYLLPGLGPLLLLTGFAWAGWGRLRAWARAVLVLPLLPGLLFALGGVVTPIHGWFQLAFPACAMEYPDLGVHLENGVYTLPRYSPLLGHWRYLGANLAGELEGGELPAATAEKWFRVERALPVSRQSTGFRHLWYGDGADRFGSWWLGLVPLLLGLGAAGSLLRLRHPKKEVAQGERSP